MARNHEERNGTTASESRLKRALIHSLLFVAVVLLFAVTGAASFALFLLLPMPWSLVCVVPPVLYFRYAGGNSWLESIITVVINGAVVAFLLGAIWLFRHLLS